MNQRKSPKNIHKFKVFQNTTKNPLKTVKLRMINVVAIDQIQR